jgi:tetratricopeptide (TPR) repeat protein
MYFQAADAFRAALELDPQESTYSVSLSIALKSSGETDQALQVSRDAIEKTPDAVTLSSHIALSLEGETEEAERLLNRCVELEPAFAWGYIGLGKVLDRKGQSGEALQQFRMATQVAPDYPPAWSFIGDELRGRGLDDEGEILAWPCHAIINITVLITTYTSATAGECYSPQRLPLGTSPAP